MPLELQFLNPGSTSALLEVEVEMLEKMNHLPQAFDAWALCLLSISHCRLCLTLLYRHSSPDAMLGILDLPLLLTMTFFKPSQYFRTLYLTFHVQWSKKGWNTGFSGSITTELVPQVFVAGSIYTTELARRDYVMGGLFLPQGTFRTTPSLPNDLYLDKQKILGFITGEKLKDNKTNFLFGRFQSTNNGKFFPLSILYTLQATLKIGAVFKGCIAICMR